MAVIGGRYSPKSIYQKQAGLLYDLVEILVFTALDTAIDSFNSGAPTSEQVSSLLETIQAAYIVIVYQNWDGSITGRRRIRRQRFSQVVEAAQLLAHAAPMHEDFRDISAAQFSWPSFILKEQIIRIVTWTYLLDTGMVMYYKIAPCLSARDLCIGLPCPDACFEADDAEHCLRQAQKWQRLTSPSINMTLYANIRAICRKDIAQGIERSLARQSLVVLFAIAATFNTMILQLDPNIGVDNQYVPVETGVSNWRRVWAWRRLFHDGEAAHPVQTSENALPGFWINCAEYWLLAQTLLKRIATRKILWQDNRAGSRSLFCSSSWRQDEWNMSQLHAFLCLEDNRSLA